MVLDFKVRGLGCRNSIPGLLADLLDQQGTRGGGGGGLRGPEA